MARTQTRAVLQPKPLDLVTYDLEVEQADQPVEGNASAWGTEEDATYAAEINARLDRGDVWAWCTVKVTASVDVNGETVTGVAYLGGCCYENEADFLRCEGEQQRAEALADLKTKLEAMRDNGPRADQILKAL